MVGFEKEYIKNKICPFVNGKCIEDKCLFFRKCNDKNCDCLHCLFFNLVNLNYVEDTTEGDYFG